MIREEARRLLIELLDSVRAKVCALQDLDFSLRNLFCLSQAILPLAVPVQRRGKKVLVLDPKVSGFLGLLAEVSLLKEHGIEQCGPFQSLQFVIVENHCSCKHHTAPHVL
jgi:hypothetical protein